MYVKCDVIKLLIKYSSAILFLHCTCATIYSNDVFLGEQLVSYYIEWFDFLTDSIEFSSVGKNISIGRCNLVTRNHSSI